MRRLAILGASGHGAVVADTAECSGWQGIDFFDDAWPTKNNHLHWPIKGNSDSLLKCHAQYDGVVVAIGHNTTRRIKQQILAHAGAKLTIIQHPSATVSRYAVLGKGTVVFAGAIVNAGAVIGDGVILNTGCTIDHDSMIGDFAHISPGAHLAGEVHVGRECWVGIGASIRQQIRIGDNATVGAGAVVINNVPADRTVIGVPAK